ncbi:MAG: hypothetical protein CM15mP74_31300 [Halieaceae bacterium]|nr:MAG: hypothetical protein CM15mP74_31300 [Halieaceae bacterium]
MAQRIGLVFRPIRPLLRGLAEPHRAADAFAAVASQHYQVTAGEQVAVPVRVIPEAPRCRSARQHDGGQTQPRRTLGHPMVWVVLAMALLWAWGVSREDTTYAPPQQQASPSVSSAQLLFIDGPKGRIDV